MLRDISSLNFSIRPSNEMRLPRTSCHVQSNRLEIKLITITVVVPLRFVIHPNEMLDVTLRRERDREREICRRGIEAL